jgi:protein-tyrosine phosphatase
MDNFVKRAPGNKIFVHCHAGMGRTAIVCCSYLIFAGIATSGQDAIKLVQTQRPGALGKKNAQEFVVTFFETLVLDKRKLWPSESCNTLN